jgi:glycosyltransferase involved in cell wall biosynthesis
MRKWDLQAAKRPDVMIANSTHIAEEIKKYYHREAVVIHPPVDTKRFVKTKKTKRTGYVIAGRQTPYKRFDLAIATANIMQLPLEVLGDGPEHARLVAAGGPTVTFKTNVSDQDIVLAFQSAKGFLFTGLDDFGITPVEAMAAGCPVIAYKAGGALDYVEDGVTGVFFDKQSPQSVVTAIRRFEATEFKESIVVKKAVSFNPEAFKVRIRDLVEKEFAKFHK